MAASQRGQARNEITFVRINDILLYGWKTKDLSAISGVSASDLANQLGHLTAANAAAIANRIMVTGANSPKPARVTRRNPGAATSQQGSVSTFVAFDKMAAANAGGWSGAKRGRGVNLRANVPGVRTVTAVAELSNGLLYAYPLNKDDYDLVGDSLGLQSAAQISSLEAKKLATGCRTKPGTAAIADNGGALSTFFSTDARDSAMTAGFSILQDEFIEYTAASAPNGN